MRGQFYGVIPRMAAKWAQHEMGHGHGRHRGGPWRQMWGEDWGGRRARRGDVKFLILEVLAERPRHGYDIMQVMGERQGGAYRPSPGSVYPTLQMLEDGGYVTSEQVDGKRVYTITDAGRTLLTEREAEPEGFGDEDEADKAREALRAAAMKLAGVVMQGAGRLAEPKTQVKVRDVLERARKEIYQILAEEQS